jgi:hypothetical protein
VTVLIEWCKMKYFITIASPTIILLHLHSSYVISLWILLHTCFLQQDWWFQPRMVAKKSVDIGPKQAFLQPNKLIKFIEPYTSTKGTLREEVCSRLIKPTSQAYLGNVRLLTSPITCGTIVQTRVQTGGKTQHYPRHWSSDTMIKFIKPYFSTKST